MKHLIPLLSALVLSAPLLAACDGDETLTSYGAADRTWALQGLDGARVPAGATLTFPEPGRIAGQGPCNSFSGAQTAPYPWFDTGPLAVTRRACPDLAQESAFLAALETMTLVEIQGDTMILTNDAGRQMTFEAIP